MNDLVLSLSNTLADAVARADARSWPSTLGDEALRRGSTGVLASS